MIAPLGLRVFFFGKEAIWFKVSLVSVMVKGFVVFYLGLRYLLFITFIFCLYFLFVFFFPHLVFDKKVLED
jgi:hypothetical protein